MAALGPLLLALVLAADAGAIRDLASPEEGKRLAATRALASDASPQALRAILEAAKREPSFRVLEALVAALGGRKEPAARRALLATALQGRTLRIRRAALELLPRGDAEVLAAAEQAARNPTAPAHIRFRAVEALGLLLPEERLQSLERILAGRDPLAARAAVRAAVLSGRRDGIPRLLPLLDSKDKDLSASARDAIRGISGRGDLRTPDAIRAWWREEGAAARPGGGPVERPASYPLVAGAARNPPDRDLLLAFDTTGSFMDAWPEMRRVLPALARGFEPEGRSLRLGLVRYKSENESAPAEVAPLTYDIEAALRDAQNAPLGGFSGALRRALEAAAVEVEWADERERVVLFVGDTSPVDSEIAPLLKLCADLREADGIRISTVAVFTQGDGHRDLYRRMAEAGGGRSICYRSGFRLFYPNRPGPLDEASRFPGPDEAIRSLAGAGEGSSPTVEKP